MSRAKQNSPGEQIREIDLTNFASTFGTSGGAFVGEFVWGPVNQAVVINDANTLMRLFGKPNDYNYVDWLSAHNFLAYSNNLQLVRVVNGESAFNSTVSGSGLRVNNNQEYQNLIGAGTGVSEVFVARYPGIMGDSLKVSIADSATFDSWKYKAEFDYIPPGTSEFAAKLGAANDELHIVIVDEKGKFTGIPGAILEKYAFLSKATDNKGIDNEPNFYGNIINNQSNYIWYFSPIKGAVDLDIENSIASVTVVDAGSGYGKPIIRFIDDPAVGSPAGTGASAVATLNPLGEITAIEIVNPGTGYTDVTIEIIDSGEGATAAAQVGTGAQAGQVIAIVPVSVGTDYYSANVTITEGGQGATATAVLAATGTTKEVSLNNAGSGYSVSDVLTISGGDATFTVDTVDVGGEILTGTVNHGAGYSASATDVASTGGNGIGATFDIVVGKAVASVNVTNQGIQYGSAAVSFSGGEGSGATATATIGTGVQFGRITGITVTNGGSGYETAPTVAITTVGSGATAVAVLGEPGTGFEGQVVGYVITAAGSGYGNPQVTVTPGGSGATATAVLSVDDVAGTNWAQPNADDQGVPTAFYSLKPGIEGAWTKTLFGGSDGDPATASDLISGWDIFKNAEEVDVGLLFTGRAGGSLYSKIVIRHVIDNIAEFRRDCMVFFSPNLNDVLNKDQVDATRRIRDFVLHNVNGVGRNTSFAVCDSGWKLQYDVINDKMRWVPLNADIAGLCAQTETNFDAWWSPAGLNRGAIKNVVSLAFNPSKSARDELYKAHINPVVSFIGEGTFLYGDRTQLKKNSAFSYINVRRLFIVLQKSIGKAARNHLFEFNDDFTRSQFRGIVEPYLRMVKARRGIYDYRVICDESNNTPEVIDNAEFVASIFVKPARSINFITLNFVAVRTGVEFSEVVGVV